MPSRSYSRQFIQIISVIFLMGIIAWLATGWQETPPLQLGLEQNTASEPWAEAHLIMPVNAQTAPQQHDDLKAM